MTRKPRRRLTVSILSAGVVASLALTAPAAHAASAPDQSLSGTPTSFSTTNNSVTALATTGGVLYAGGEFTSVTPPGGSSVARTYLAAFTTTTGQPTSFDPTLNGKVNALAVSPDGSTVYVAGSFTKVNGSTRNHFAAFTVSTGALSSWNPSATGGNGYAIAASGTAVYLGGTFTAIGGTAHVDLASVNSTTGALNTAFTGSADGEIDSMALPSNGSQLVVVGYFNTLSGVSEHAVGSVDPTTGAAEPWGANNIMPNTQQCLSTGAVVTITGSTAVIGANGQQGGCYDGDFAATLASNPSSSSNGALLWNSPCEGATASLTVLNGVLYKGSHMHDCSYNPGGQYGGFSGSLSRSTFVAYRLIAQDPTNGSFIHWSPNTNGANDTLVGPLAMTNDGTRLFLGGDFTTVNGSAREGLAVFSPKSITPSAAPKTPTVAPTATPGNGDVTVTFPADTDTDNGVLTYTIYRGTSTQVAQLTAESWPWAQPTLRYTDTGLTPGSSYTYHYKVSDGTTTTSSSPNSASATVLSSVPSYQSTVLGDHPSVDWRLDDTSGNTAADSSGNNVTGQYNSGDTLNQPGAVGSDAAITTDGSTGYVASNSQLSPSTGFTETAWFKTSSLSGGTIMGDSTTQSPSAGTADDGIWMDDDGQVAFDITAPMPTGPPSPGQVPPSPLRSANTYNDGQWHQVVGTYDGSTQNLYIDGVLVGTQAYTATNPFQGYLVAGYDNLNSFMHVFGQNTTTQTSPNSYYFNGGLDEVAAYPAALSTAQVTAQWQGNADLGGGGGGSPTPGQVTNVNGTATSSSVSLTWNAVSGATSYEVDRSSTSASSGYSPVTTTDSTNAYTDNTVASGTNYWYEVTASNGTQGPASAAYPISTPTTVTTPGQVTNVNGTATSSSVSLTWDAVSGATSYEVDRSSTSASSGYSPVTTTDSTNAYTDNTVASGTNYWYEVTASNGTQGPASAAYPISTPGSSGGTALLANSFEGGSNGTTLTAANSGGGSGNKFNTVSCSGGTATYTSTNPAHGSLAGSFAPSTAACYTQWTSASIPTTTTSYGRMYVNLSAGGNTVVLAKLATSAGTRDAQIAITTAGKLALYDANNTKQATSTNNVPTGWVRIEWTLVNSTTAGSLSVSMYSGDNTAAVETLTASGINTGAGFGNLAVGSVVATKTALSPFELDDVAYGTSGPLGPGS